jgi:branched-chain amino acid transport system substrate-binding protein
MFAVSNFKFLISDCRFRLAGRLLARRLLARLLLARLLLAPRLSARRLLARLVSARLPLAGSLLATLIVWTLHGFAQTPPAPYAVIPRESVNYSGPGRDAHHDLEGPEIKIGLLAPLTGPHQAEGRALLQAAQLAIEDEVARALPGGRRLLLVPRDQSGLWGRTSNEVVHLVYEDQAVAIVTSLDGASAHLAEQVANKVGIPVVTLSSDPTTTQINLPWIFRLGPTDTQQARAFARDIYVARKLRQVILITENGHDGRVGGEEFRKAARQLNAPSVTQLAIDPADWNRDSVLSQIMAQKPEVLVFWTGQETAAKLLPPLRKAFPTAPVYLCHEAAQGRFDGDLENIWIVTPRLAGSPLRESFEKRYRARAATVPSAAAAQAYDAVRILAAALRRSGPNRARLRDALAALPGYTGASGTIAFDHAGNDLSDVTLVRLR